MVGFGIAENLQLLCSFEHSVSHACREMGINRQQFSKYLSGISKPSTRNLNKICNHFSVRPADLYLPNDEFSNSALITQRQSKVAKLSSKGPAYRSAFDGHTKSLKKYLGYYQTYFYSFSWDGMILCTLCRVFNDEGQICTRNIERVRDPGSQALFLSKYDGQAAWLGDKIFVSEYQSLEKDAIVETVLYPTGRSELTYLQGVTFGLSSRQKNPYLSRTVWRYLGDNIDLRTAMNSVGLIDPASRKIDPHVLQLLGEPNVRGASLQFNLDSN